MHFIHVRLSDVYPVHVHLGQHTHDVCQFFPMSLHLSVSMPKNVSGITLGIAL